MALLAALVLAIHLAWLALVIFGALWTRGRPVWSTLHILALLWGIAVEVGPWSCPLTLAEEYFESRAGAASLSRQFSGALSGRDRVSRSSRLGGDVCGCFRLRIESLRLCTSIGEGRCATAQGSLKRHWRKQYANLLAGWCVVSVGWKRLRLGAGGHGLESFEIRQHLSPFFGILLGRDGQIWICVVGQDVFLDAGRNRLLGVAREAVEKIGVGRVSQRISAGLHHAARVKVAIGQGMPRVPRLQ